MAKSVGGNIDWRQLKAASRQGDANVGLSWEGPVSPTPGTMIVVGATGGAAEGAAVPTGTVTHTAGALTADMPVLGAGAGDVKAGTAGQLVPSGGTTGQVLSKTSDTDGDVEWATPGAIGPYDIVCSYVGKPDAGATVFLMTFTRTVTFADEFSGSYGTVGANPTSTAEYTIKQNGVTCGSISVSTGGAFTFVTSSPSGEVSFAAGDRMTITAPATQDATLSDVAFTLAGTR